MDNIDILKIDNRGRIVIPKSSRKALGINTDSEIIAIANYKKQNILLLPLIASKETITFLIESKHLPEAYLRNIKDFAEAFWGREATVTHKNSSENAIARIKEIIRKNLEEEEKFEELKLEPGARVVLPKSLRKMVNIAPDSHIMAITKSKEKELQLIPFIGSKNLITLRITRKNSIEWRIISPVPKDIDSIINSIQEQEKDLVDIVITANIQ